MYPHERSLVRLLSGKPFAIVGVNSDTDRSTIRKVVAEKEITWRSFWNGPNGTRGPISTKWGVTGWPTTYLIDKDGVIRYKNVRGKSLDAAIEVLMAEMGEDVSLVDVDHEAEDAKAMKVDAEKVDAEKVDAEKVDAEKVDAEKVDAEKVDAEKVDAEKVDAEKVDN